MKAQQGSTVVGVFQDHQEADRAVAELREAGFRDDQIGVAMRHDDGTGETAGTETGDDSHAAEGALGGIVAGLGLGALAGLGVLSGFIPVIGPAIAGGTLGVILSNAAAGAAVAGLAGALIGSGLPEHEAQYYQGEFQAGRIIVTVQADGRADEARAILRRHGAYDMSSRPDVAGSTGTATATATGDACSTTPGTTRVADTGEGETMALREERLRAEKHPVETGEVRVRKEVHTETQTLEVPVQREEVVIERTPVHGGATAEGISAGDIRAGEEIRIPVREDQVEVTKNAVVTEEVNVGKRVVQDTKHVTGQVRKEDVKVERKGDVDARTCGPGETPA